MPRARNPKSLKLIPPAKRQRRKIEFPEKMLNQKVTAAMLARGSYQKKMLAFVLPLLLPQGFNSLLQALEEGNLQAVRMLFEQAGLVQPAKGATTIIAPQFQNNNANKASAVAAAAVADADKRNGPSDFEEILKILEDERSTITIRNKQLEPTPEGAAGE